MSATIYSFPGATPKPETHTYRLSLYTDIEVEAVMAVVNIFSILDDKITYLNVRELDPRLVVQCLEAGIQSWMFTDEFKKIFKSIINNMQVT